ncbi:MAG: hypothetical protein AAF368_00995 [Planctomycetota bacterium]
MSGLRVFEKLRHLHPKSQKEGLSPAKSPRIRVHHAPVGPGDNLIPRMDPGSLGSELRGSLNAKRAGRGEWDETDKQSQADSNREDKSTTSTKQSAPDKSQPGSGTLSGRTMATKRSRRRLLRRSRLMHSTQMLGRSLRKGSSACTLEELLLRKTQDMAKTLQLKQSWAKLDNKVIVSLTTLIGRLVQKVGEDQDTRGICQVS